MKFIVLSMLSVVMVAAAESEGSTSYLNALQGMDGGYCVVLEDEQGNVKELVTTKGGLSKGQIRKTVRYASYRQHLTGGGLLALGPAVAAATKAKGRGAVLLAYTSLPAVFAIGQVRYLQKLASTEEETSTASIASMFSIIPPVSFLTEEVIRISRANSITDRREKLRFSSSDDETDNATLGFVKLDKIVARMKEIPAKYPNSCKEL